ncbi:exodeoxyribonuclease VII large subunit [Marinospirillum sp.]|uniref:exodeoxyribonuclease VII large subunit n=1 Tax=Marinospirillum sp. TaxID=2183934 RepID=UPI003A84E526
MPQQSAFQPQTELFAPCLSVSQLNQQARRLLEGGLINLWVEGEISNFTPSASGHWYFTLKDEQAQISCVLFSQRQLLLKPPKNGDQVRLKGQVSLYEQRGQYQFLVTGLRQTGLGDALLRFEELKQKLQAEGLFDPARRRPLPLYPDRIGVITSAQGAALQDVLKVIERRWPIAEVLLYPAQVQGKDAPSSLRRALALAQYHGQPEVLLLVRGGGSLEDLQAFNDEVLARMVAASAMPVVTGVGHETDTTLVDFVSDQRAPTPSVAAETVTPERAQLLAKLQQQQGRALHALMVGLRAQQQRLDELSWRCTQPRQLALARQRWMQLDQRLQAQHPQRRQVQQRARWAALQTRLMHQHPQRGLARHAQRLEALREQLRRSHQQQIIDAQSRWREQLGRLDLISPLKTLARGYALVTPEAAPTQPLRTAQQVQVGDRLQVQLGQGRLSCLVLDTQPAEGDTSY